jgi:5-methylcytosine-specific restriction endonuclease McrA
MPSPPRRSSSRRGGRKKKAAKAPRLVPSLTSVPTGRAAYTETRLWLLARHGPVCAYCERRVTEHTITLDHVTPRRGQTAYDRRDNLVLCCKTCNASKADKSIMAFLLGSRKRVVALYKYGQHLSHQLVEMVKDLLPESERPPLPPLLNTKGKSRRKSSAELFGRDEHAASPYLDG